MYLSFVELRWLLDLGLLICGPKTTFLMIFGGQYYAMSLINKIHLSRFRYDLTQNRNMNIKLEVDKHHLSIFIGCYTCPISPTEIHTISNFKFHWETQNSMEFRGITGVIEKRKLKVPWNSLEFYSNLTSSMTWMLLQYIPRNMHMVLLCFALFWLCNRS